MESVVSELEGTLLKDPDPFSYFMLVAFEASGVIRFAILLMAWPILHLLDILGMGDAGLKLMIFISVVGVRECEIESVARAVLPKFYMDDVDLGAWRVFSCYKKRLVVTRSPRVMVERFVKEHLGADEVIGIELQVNRFGFATGLVKDDIGLILNRVKVYFKDEQPTVGLVRPHPVIFHDGRLVNRPTPSMALLTLLWLPLGILLATMRIIVGLSLVWRVHPYTISRIIGSKLVVKGQLPPPLSSSNSGVLFVCTHRTLMDALVLSVVLQRKIPAVTYSLSLFSEIISPIPTLRLTRKRNIDAEIIKKSLSKGDLVVCPEGTTCREPFLLRFSALFAELTNHIVPVAMTYRVGFFHATTARGWKALDPIFFFMNPRPEYEVTFLNQLPMEATCASGKSPHDVANYVQRILAATLGFQCTNFTRKDKYIILVGNDGTVSDSSGIDHVRNVVSIFKHSIHIQDL
ncbi:hypothetical protein AQUCO_00900929v1 [Aquilegia coerulea]|uniref:Phospholipid/glycerol acyltransferase domain-containing protein n=1 Tax=Aquilegia coerulea TaxID=218851 RepID=A0A2G5EGJ7_AQUCA|nr:hypothetical protein AQUCO_00900929v1 [Aquilegia coerulea]